MAITINGSGTITGVSAGGLPDGSVNADTLASTLDISSKTLTLPNGSVGANTLASTLDLSSKTLTIPTNTTGLPAGTVVQVKTYTNSTSTTLSAGSSDTIWQMSFNKTSPTSTLVFQGILPGTGSVNHQTGERWYYGSTSIQYKGIRLVRDSDWQSSAAIHVNAVLSGYTTTGSQTFGVGWTTANGSSTRPFYYWNPNNQANSSPWNPLMSSQMTIMEIEE